MSDAALSVLGERGTDAVPGAIQATLRVAGADPTVGEELRHGRFERELTGATGFPDFPGLTLVPDLEPTATTAAKPERGARPRKAPPKSKPKPGRGADRAAERAAQAEQARAAREREAAEERARLREDAEDAARLASEELAAAEAAAAAVHQRIDALKHDLDPAAARSSGRGRPRVACRSRGDAPRACGREAPPPLTAPPPLVVEPGVRSATRSGS